MTMFPHFCLRTKLYSLLCRPTSSSSIGKGKFVKDINVSIIPEFSTLYTCQLMQINLIRCSRVFNKTEIVQSINKKNIAHIRLYQSASSKQQGRLNYKVYVPLLFGVYAFILLSLYAINECKKNNKKIEKLDDPLMKGNDAAAFKHKGFWLPITLVGGEKTLQQIEEFEVNGSDIYVVSFPKSGELFKMKLSF